MSRKQKLELTWVGKDERPRLEPRILLEDPSLSYHAARRVSADDRFDNVLIHGDNLLALKALEQQYRGKVKCIYIDPPFNTQEAMPNYDDSVEHSVWLGFMADRLSVLWSLLHPTGSIFVHLNDDEVDYCKVLLDEIFGRKNFVNRITLKARSPSAFSTVNRGLFKASEYVLWFAKDKTQLSERSGRVPRSPDLAYSDWLSGDLDDPSTWRFSSVLDVYQERASSKSKHPARQLEHFHRFMLDNAARIVRLAEIDDSGAGEEIVALKTRSLASPGIVHWMRRSAPLSNVYVLDGKQVLFYERNVMEIDGARTATAFMTNQWMDIAWEGIAKEGGVTFKRGKKPERLVKRVLELATDPGDLVLDSFAGSGTTPAVAHKMKRRWIAVEIGEHCITHVLPRLRDVVDGRDASGVSRAVGWAGGGGFRYLRLAPSLMEQDVFGNLIINPVYNAEMLAQAVCQLMGFRYAPSERHYWQHGQAAERDYIYVTTAALTHAQLRAISEDVGSERTLLICCKAFDANVDAFPNLTVKKIPQAVLDKCEWGRDDYSLRVAALPQAEPAVGASAPAVDGRVAEAQPPAPRAARPAARRKPAVAPAPSLFDEPHE